MVPTLITIDTHTEGQPTRIVIGGLRNVPGGSMHEKRDFLKREYDWLRRGLIHEPRGHKDMFGAIITPPTSKESCFGVVFMDSSGYLNMCAHGTIGVITAAWHMGWFPDAIDGSTVSIDTPAGDVKADLAITGGHLKAVEVENVSSFVFQKNVAVATSLGGTISADIAFGGSFFALVNVETLPFTLDHESLHYLVRLGKEIRELLNAHVLVQHPAMPYINGIDLVEFYSRGSRPYEGRNIVVFGDGQVDRSPCGTGTCARMALLHENGELPLNQEYLQRGILDTSFTGKLTRETTVGELAAVIPRIAGAAFITGRHTFLLDPSDPFAHGFAL